MTGEVVTVHPRLSLQELALLFERDQISGAPVVDDRGHVTGVVTRTDLSTLALRGPDPEAEVFGLRIREPGGEDFYEVTHGLPLEGAPGPQHFSPSLRVEDVMSPRVVSVEADAELREIARAMLEHRIHRLLVTDGPQFVGILTTTDVLRWLVEGAPAAPESRRGDRTCSEPGSR